MTSQTLKLAAIGFYKPDPSALVLHCEELYIYGVLSQLARFTDIQYKDFATLSDKIEPDWMNPDQATTLEASLAKLGQICQSTRTQFLFTGTLAQAENLKSELQINFQLYEAERNQLIVAHTTTLSLDIGPLTKPSASLYMRFTRNVRAVNYNQSS